MTPGLSRLRLCAQAVDQQAALAGAGCVSPGRVKATYGTDVFILAHTGEDVPRPAGGLLPTVAWEIAGRTEYAIDVGVFAAGATLDWLCRELGLAETAAARGPLAGTVEDSAGARVLPALAGIGAPRWHPAARAVIAGLHGEDDARARRARVARGHRVARRRRRRGCPRDCRDRDAAGRRWTHKRAADAPAAGRRDRGARRCGRRGRHGGGRRGTRGGGRGAARIAGPRQPSCCPWTAVSNRAAATAGARRSISAGAGSSSAADLAVP